MLIETKPAAAQLLGRRSPSRSCSRRDKGPSCGREQLGGEAALERKTPPDYEEGDEGPGQVSELSPQSWVPGAEVSLCLCLRVPVSAQEIRNAEAPQSAAPITPALVILFGDTRLDFWLCAQGSLLAMLRASYAVQRSNPGQSPIRQVALSLGSPDNFRRNSLAEQGRKHNLSFTKLQIS